MGLIPFGFFTLLAWIVNDQALPFVALSMVAYAALIISFLASIGLGGHALRPVQRQTPFAVGHYTQFAGMAGHLDACVCGTALVGHGVDYVLFGGPQTIPRRRLGALVDFALSPVCWRGVLLLLGSGCCVITGFASHDLLSRSTPSPPRPFVSRAAACVRTRAGTGISLTRVDTGQLFGERVCSAPPAHASDL
jgi:hypothetical protein